MIQKSEILTEIADRHRKRVMKQPSKKLKRIEVERIRISFLKDGTTVAQLSRDFDVSTQIINNILRGYGAYRYNEDMI